MPFATCIIYQNSIYTSTDSLHLCDYHTGAKAAFDGKFNEGEKPSYWLDKVKCNGTEESLFQCASSGTGRSNCRKDNRARVKCTGMDNFLPHLNKATAVLIPSSGGGKQPARQIVQGQ